MSIRRAGQTVETLYVGTQDRKIPFPGEKVPKGSVYSVTMNKQEIYGCPIITLNVGQRYKFIIDTPGHPFYITTDPNGGGMSKKASMIGSIEIQIETAESLGNVGIEKGVLVWTPTSDHAQMQLFYQCNYHKSMGNKINVIDNKAIKF